MTDKEKRKLKAGVISKFNRFNILDNTATIGGLRDDILRYINSFQEESVSDDLEEEIGRYFKENGDKWAYTDVARHFAKWQKQQDQSTIELAEDHAYFAGRTKTIDEMMEKAVETTFNVSLPSSLYDKLCVKGCKEGDKLLVIKKDEL